jgi:hypothetical protein
MSKRFFRGYLLVFVAVTASAYAHWTWRTSEHAVQIALSLEGKPFVYRALVPWLARGLMALGLAAETALSVLVILSAIGLFYGLDFLRRSLRR